MQQDQFNILWDKYKGGAITPEEWDTLRTEIATGAYDPMLEDDFIRLIHANPYPEYWTEDAKNRMWLNINTIAQKSTKVHFLKTAWLRYAAILLLIAGTATYLYTSSWKEPKVTRTAATPKPQDIPPGADKAILTLSDGSTIELETQDNGKTIEQLAGADVLGKAQPIRADESNATYNTITTPKGGQYQITLPDGTKVWLNAASSIKFPTAFGKDRTVEITGESYLEVATDKTKPFFVKSASTTIEVLGTSFNINAYPEEPATKTSLAEGSIKIGNTLLKPGQALANGKLTLTNLQQDLAWKNGLFIFEKTEVHTVLRQLARWYNLEIIYKGSLPSTYLNGEISRNEPLSRVLHLLQLTGKIKFSLEGNKLTVSTT